MKYNIKNLRNRTIVEYVEPDQFSKVGHFHIPSGEEMDRQFKKQSKRKIETHTKPKNMYRVGTVESSDILKKGVQVYYSQYDATEFWHNQKRYNVILDAHILGELSTVK